MKDPYIGEATANWASAIVTDKTTNEGFLNEWAGTAKLFSNILLGEEFEKKYGIENVGYALYVYLYNYSTTVEDGITKVIDSIYEEDSLKYLQDNCTSDEYLLLQSEIILNFFTNDSDNNNINVSPENDGKFPIKETINYELGKEYNYEDVDIPKLGMHCYKIDDNSKKRIQMELDDNYSDMVVCVLAEKDGEYFLELRAVLNEYTIYGDIDDNYLPIDTGDFSDEYNRIFTDTVEYDALYVVVINPLPATENKYSLNIKCVDDYNGIWSSKDVYVKEPSNLDKLDDDIEITHYYRDGKCIYHVIMELWDDEEYGEIRYNELKNNSKIDDMKSYGEGLFIKISDDNFYSFISEKKLKNAETKDNSYSMYNPVEYLD